MTSYDRRSTNAVRVEPANSFKQSIKKPVPPLRWGAEARNDAGLKKSGIRV